MAEERSDVVIMIHAARSHAALRQLREQQRETPVALILSGTDIYPDPSEEAIDAMRMADSLVVLQERALRQIPVPLRDKARVIVQSAERWPAAPCDPNHFDICVAGHLRAVKDPLRAANASRLLPPSSKIRIQHCGRILEERYAALVDREQAENSRYNWLGALPPREARELIASSRLQVLSSLNEGGAHVLGESIVSGTPVLASRNDAALSVLGESYPGLFETGDSAQLAALMRRAEEDPGFLAELQEDTKALAPLFDPKLERESLGVLFAELGDCIPSHTKPPS